MGSSGGGARAGQGTPAGGQIRKLELDDTTDHLRPIHPALDVVDDVLYLTVQARVGGRLQDIVVTSEGEAFTRDAWREKCTALGLYPVAETDLTTAGLDAPRWTNEAIRRLQEGTLEALPWGEMYDRIRAAFEERLRLKEERYFTVLTLYAMATYFHPLFEQFPYLHLHGPAESGKSRAAWSLARVAFNGVTRGDATDAATFRAAHLARPTLVLTECDWLKEAKSGDARVARLQAGFSREEAKLTLTEEGPGRKRTPVTYQTYCPRVLVSTQRIGSPPLRTRVIVLDLVKQPGADTSILRKSVGDEEVWRPLRDGMYRLTLRSFREVEMARESLKATWTVVSGRTFDKWLPLATIAQLVSDEVLAEVQQLAVESQAEDRQEAAYADGAALLFKFAAFLVDGQDDEVFISASDLYGRFTEVDPSGSTAPYGWREPIWAEQTHTTATVENLRKWLKGPRQLVAELKKLTLVDPEPVHMREGNVWVLRPAHVRALVEEYIADPFTDDQAA